MWNIIRVLSILISYSNDFEGNKFYENVVYSYHDLASAWGQVLLSQACTFYHLSCLYHCMLLSLYHHIPSL